MLHKTRVSSDGIATGYELKAGVRFMQGQEMFLRSTAFKTGAEDHPTFYPMGTEALKRPWCESIHSPSPSAEVKDDGATHPLSRTYLWCGI
jgi:hypothetical protein